MDARVGRHSLRSRLSCACAVHRGSVEGILVRAGTARGAEEEVGAPDRMTSVDQILRDTPSFRRLSAEDRHRVAAVAHVKSFARGDTVFAEAEPSDFFYSVASGR